MEASQWKQLTTGLKLSVLALNFWGGQGVMEISSIASLYIVNYACVMTSPKCVEKKWAWGGGGSSIGVSFPGSRKLEIASHPT